MDIFVKYSKHLFIYYLSIAILIKLNVLKIQIQYIRIFGEYSDISHMMEAYYLLLLV